MFRKPALCVAVATAAMLLACLSNAQQTTERSAEAMPALHGLMFNQDCTDFFWTRTIKDGVDGGAVLDQYIDDIAAAGVTVLLCNTNARKTNYDSAVVESFWDGYDPNGPDDQPFLAPVPRNEVATYRRGIHSMWALHAQGVDYPARMISRSREKGMSPWITLRMNDVHYNDRLDHPFHGDFWREEKYFRGGGGYYGRGLDYAHPEVRDLYRALIVETLERYDIDGLELDFMREPYLFRPGAEAEGAAILLEWMREVRALVLAEAARRGHDILLAVRVPSHPEVADGWGLRAVDWAKEGLIDLVVATPRWATLEYDMPIGKWRDLLAGTGVTLAGGLEILHRPMPGSPAVALTGEHATGAAVAVLDGGADVAYLFNYFLPIAGNPGWGKDGYNRVLGAMSSLDALVKLPRRHAVTWRDITGPGEAYRYPLPAEGAQVSFDLPTGPPPGEGAQANLLVEAEGDAAQAPPAARVNGASCTFREARLVRDGVLLLEYVIPLEALASPGPERIELAAPEARTIEIVGLEVRIVPGPQQ